MSTKNKKIRHGLTMVEVIIAMAFLIAIVLGTMGFSYYSALDAKKADVKSSAARLCSMILEDWKATGGKPDYDAVNAFGALLNITKIETDTTEVGSVSNPAGFYHVVVNHVNYYVNLWYDNPTSVRPRTLNVSVSWTQNFSTWDGTSPTYSTTLTTYSEN